VSWAPNPSFTPPQHFHMRLDKGSAVRASLHFMTRTLELGHIDGQRYRSHQATRVLSANLCSDIPRPPRRLGDRWAVATIRARALGTYLCLRPRPAAISCAASPWELNRLTRSATVVPLRKPANCAARMNGLPCATARIAVARRTRSTRSQPALTMRSNAACSDPLMARNGSRCGVGIPGLLSSQSIRPLLQLRPYTA